MTDPVEKWTDIVQPAKIEDLVKTVRANLDPYGACVVGSVILVMASLATGSMPEQASKEMSTEVTGFQAGAIASLVSQLSPRGDEYRRWWNLSTQVGKEGERANEGSGVLNPALLHIEGREG